VPVIGSGAGPRAQRCGLHIPVPMLGLARCLGSGPQRAVSVSAASRQHSWPSRWSAARIAARTRHAARRSANSNMPSVIRIMLDVLRAVNGWQIRDDGSVVIAWSLNADGWLDAARIVPSPNVDARPPEVVPSLVVIHNISLPPSCFGTGDIEALFTNTLDFDAHPFYKTIRGLRVSSHFLIDRDGAIVQFASTLARAWHAGQSCFAGRERCNDFAVGIELEGCDDAPFEVAQYEALALLSTALMERHAIAAFVGHSDISPGRKTDPGPYFDWSAFARTASLPADKLPLASGV